MREQAHIVSGRIESFKTSLNKIFGIAFIRGFYK